MVRKLFICFLLLFSLNSVVFAYEYNGEPLETNAKAGDSFLGVQEVENILDTLGVVYSGENELLAYTYYINDTFDYYREFYSDNTISNLNFLFYTTNNSKDKLTVIPGNGTFSNTLRYNYINIESRLLTTVKEGTNPTVGNPPTIQPTQFTTLNKNGIFQQATTSLYLPTSTEFLITENNISVSTLVAPINTFSVYGGPPYAYYNIASTFKFFGDIEIPSGDTPGSGESGNVDLSGIQTGINNINQNLNNIENKIPTSGDIKETISGEVGKITETLTTVPDLSGEIITKQEIDDALNLDFMADPYDNFWYELTTGLSHALTDNVRQYDIPWINGYVYTFNLDTWGLKFPPAIEFVLRSMSVIAITWVIVKYWKIIVDKISSGSIDEVLAMNEEEGIIDLF